MFSMQSYLQVLRNISSSVGGAGQDGLPATCKLYYNYNDKSSLYNLFECEGTAQYSDLYKLIILLENPVCVQRNHGSLW